VFIVQKISNYVSRITLIAVLAVFTSALTTTSASAATGSLVPETPIFFPMAHIVTFLFLMLGPTKIIGPFVKVTAGADRTLEKMIARNAVVFSAIALLIAGFLGEMILKKHSIPLPILALAAGVILFLVAIQDTVRHFTFSAKEPETKHASTPTMKLALDPLAFPVIVTPYGIAALIVFLSFAPDVESQVQIGLIVMAILALDLLAMLFARKLFASLGILLAILGAVLAVVQVALGLQIIHNSLLTLGIL
jgi:multiple antibiotic resistance protein